MSLAKQKAELKAMMEFDEAPAIKAGIEQGYWNWHYNEDKTIVYDKVSEEFVEGARWQHAQFAKIAEQYIEALEVIEFYAAKENWQHGIAYSQNNLLVESDMYCEKGNHLYGGKCARAFLAKVSKETAK